MQAVGCEKCHAEIASVDDIAISLDGSWSPSGTGYELDFDVHCRNCTRTLDGREDAHHELMSEIVALHTKAMDPNMFYRIVSHEFLANLDAELNARDRVALDAAASWLAQTAADRGVTVDELVAGLKKAGAMSIVPSLA